MITFDELLARAEWHVALAEQEDGGGPEESGDGQDAADTGDFPWGDDDPF